MQWFQLVGCDLKKLKLTFFENVSSGHPRLG